LILILNILKELTILSLIFSLVNFCSATMASKKDRGKGKIVNPSDNKSEHYSVEGDSSFDFKNWSIPRLPDKEVYKTSWFKSSFRTEYAVKTVEQTIPISHRNEDFELFNKRFVNQSLAKGFKFLHVGAVQVTVKPLTRIGIDASVF